MKTLLTTTVLLLSLTLVGCDRGPKIDASTPATLKASTDLVRASMPEEEKPAFDTALMAIIANTLDPTQIIAYQENGSALTDQIVFDLVKPKLNGLTQKKVLELSVTERAALQTKVDGWLNERSGLETRLNAHKSVGEAISKLEASNASLESVATPYQFDSSSNSVKVRLTLTNGLNIPVKQVKLFVALAPEGVTSPWVRQSLTHDFETPLLPGQSVEVVLGPLNIEIPPSFQGQAQLAAEMEMTEVASADGKTVLKRPHWSASDTFYLAKLEVATDTLKSMGLP